MKALDGHGFVRPEPKCTTVCRLYQWSYIDDCWDATPTCRWFIHRDTATYWVSTRLPDRPLFNNKVRWFVHEQDLRGYCRIYPIPLND